MNEKYFETVLMAMADKIEQLKYDLEIQTMYKNAAEREVAELNEKNVNLKVEIMKLEPIEENNEPK